MTAFMTACVIGHLHKETAELKPTKTDKLPVFLPIPEPTYEEKKAKLIRELSFEFEVEEKLIYAMIKQESRGNHKAVSRKGAIGYMQLMPRTAKELGVDPHDPFDNLRGGVKYISKQLKKFKGDVRLALAAYNAGPGNVQKYGGIPPFKETNRYVLNIMNTLEETV